MFIFNTSTNTPGKPEKSIRRTVFLLLPFQGLRWIEAFRVGNELHKWDQ